MRSTFFSVVLAGLTVMGIASPAWGDTRRRAPDAPWVTRCRAMASADFSGIVDAPTQVMTATPVEVTHDVPAHCQVHGYIWPQVGFLLTLPASGWNGKFLELGCGGDCGNDVTGYAAAGSGYATALLRRGYAYIGSDAGHTGGGGLWASNNLQAQVDFGYRGPHVTALAGKAITERYYNKPPKYSYFIGGSTGGRQALVLAQRFPWDFDGIISGAPWINDTESAMHFVWAHRALSGKDGKPIVSRANLKLVHDAVLAKCELDDGVKDGVIGNPAACKFDPDELVCKASKKDGCLTQAQADAVKKVYTGPVNSKGEKTYVGGAAPGSELGWVDDPLLAYIRSDSLLGGSESWALSYFRYMVMPAAGPTWKLTDFDFDRDHKRFGTGIHESLLNAANPDLRKFKAAGGKLIIWQGWNDQSDLPAMTIDYYETVERTMGGREATQDFLRLFMLPGVYHTGLGEGAFAVDYLSYLEAWVEKGQAPEKLIGSHVRFGDLRFDPSDLNGTLQLMRRLQFPLDPAATIEFSRPIYPYPKMAKYLGHGDPKNAVSFGPVEP